MSLMRRWSAASITSRTLAATAVAVTLALMLAWLASADDAGARPVVLRPGADGAFVRSQEGTVPDGDLGLWGGGKTLSALGGGLPYAELRRLFDYYLSAWGEQDIPAIVARIEQELQRQLPPAQQADATALLRKYLDYKRALVDLEKSLAAQAHSPGIAAIRQRFDGMLALRARFFSPREDEGMFGFDDAYDRDAIARLAVQQDGSLSSAQKRERLAVLDAAMPAAVKAERDAPRQIILLEEQVQALRAQGGSDAQVFALRAKALNPEAAQRLATVDREEQEWQTRIADYLRERQKVLQSGAGSAGSERDAALAQLQQSRFAPAEIPRLAAYEN